MNKLVIMLRRLIASIQTHFSENDHKKAHKVTKMLNFIMAGMAARGEIDRRQSPFQHPLHALELAKYKQHVANFKKSSYSKNPF